MGTVDTLVMQKDALLKLVNAGELDKATVILDFLAESWTAEGYGYKVKEIRQRIADAEKH